MSFKKVVAVVLAVFMTVGFSGCDKNKKDRKEIENLMDDYIAAINDFDFDGVVELSDWDEDDASYVAFKETLGYEFPNDEQKSFYKCIASTATLNYKSEDIEFDGDKATLNAKYEIVNWSEAIRGKSFSDLQELLGLIKDCDETRTVRVRFNLAKTGDGWKLHQVSNVSDLLDFVIALKNITLGGFDPDVTDPTDPTGDTQPSGNTESILGYPEVAGEYIRVLEENKAAIDNFHVDFGRLPCGVYDINGDGTVELYFFAEGEGQGFKTGTFYVYTFDPSSGKAVPVVTAKDVAKTGVQSGGDYVVFVSGGKIGIMYTDGEEALFSYETDIFTIDFTNDTDEYYLRQVYYEYNPETDEDIYTIYRYEGGNENGEKVMYITESWNYEDPLYEYYSQAEIMLFVSFNFVVDEPEYPLFPKPTASGSTCEDLITYLKSVQ